VELAAARLSCRPAAVTAPSAKDRRGRSAGRFFGCGRIGRDEVSPQAGARTQTAARGGTAGASWRPAQCAESDDRAWPARPHPALSTAASPSLAFGPALKTTVAAQADPKQGGGPLRLQRWNWLHQTRLPAGSPWRGSKAPNSRRIQGIAATGRAPEPTGTTASTPSRSIARANGVQIAHPRSRINSDPKPGGTCSRSGGGRALFGVAGSTTE